MGRRGNLYQAARDCINALKTGSPLSQHVVFDDLGMSIIYVTRRHLRETATIIIDILEQNEHIVNVNVLVTPHKMNEHCNFRYHMKRYHRLAFLHATQMKRYDRQFRSLACLAGNISYLKSINFMMSNLVNSKLRKENLGYTLTLT